MSDVLVEAIEADGEPQQVVASDWSSSSSQHGNHEQVGGFRLVLDPGRYTLRVSRDDTSQLYGGQQAIVLTVEAGQYLDLEDIAIAPVPEGRFVGLSGSVEDLDDAPIAGRWVTLFRSQRGGQQFVNVDAEPTGTDGSFSFEAAPVGKDLVACVQTSGWENACGPEGLPLGRASAFRIPTETTDRHVLDEPLLDPTVVVTARVSNADGTPYQENNVTLLERNEWGGHRGYGGWTDASGMVSFRGVRPGDGFFVCFSLDEGMLCADGVTQLSEASTFEVPATSATFTAPDLVMPFSASVTGMVVDAQDRAVPDARVILFRDNGSGSWRPIFSARSGLDGSFTLRRRAEAGRYSVCVLVAGATTYFCSNGGETGQFPGYDGGMALSSEQNTHALESPLVVPAAVRVTGSVVDQQGKPRPHSYVELRRPQWYGEGGYAVHEGWAIADEFGAYSFSVIPGEDPMTVCSYGGDGLECLGGGTDPMRAETFTVTGAADVLDVPDLRTTDYGTRCGEALTNGTLSMGLGCNGQLGAGGGYNSDNSRPLVGLGMAGGPDAVAVECLCEGWGVADASTGRFGIASGHQGSSVQRLSFVPGAGSNDPTTSTTYAAGTFQVTHEAVQSVSSNAYLLRVRITNVGDQDTELRYRRVVDWDVAPTAFDEIVSMETGGLPEIVFASNDGFADPNPLSRPSTRGAKGSFRNYGPKDQGSLMDFDFGRLGAGQTKAFTLAYGAAESESAAEAVLEQLGAKAYSVATASSGEVRPAYFLAYGVDDEQSQTAPMAAADDVVVGEGGVVEIDVLANDVDPQGGQLVVTGASGAQHGTVMCGPETCTYQHHGDGSTSDRFRYTIRNELGQTAVGLVRIQVEELAASAEMVTRPRVAPDTQLTTGDELVVVPGEYTNEKGELTRSYTWRADFGPDVSTIYTDDPTSVIIPAWARGARIFVEETVRATGYAPVVTRSDLTEVVAGRPMLTPQVQPTFEGTPVVGQPVSPAAAVWNETPDAVEHFWYVGGREVSAGDPRLSEGGAVFTPVDSDAGKRLWLDVVASKSGYQDGYAWASAPRIGAADERLTAVRVVVTGPGGSSVPDAWVYACADDRGCFELNSSSTSGTFTGDLAVDDDGSTFKVSVYPWSGSLLSTTREVVVKPSETAREIKVQLKAPAPTPPNATFDAGGGTREVDGGTIAVGYVGKPATFEVRGCASVAEPTWTVTFASGAESMTGPLTVIEADVELATYRAEIPGFTSSGSATVSTNVPAACGEEPTEFTIYIDPAGIVTDQFGRPIESAEVTLLQERASGFEVVADGDEAVMDPEVNTKNPSLTDPTGFFRWDVAAGTYRVQVTRASSGGASCAAVTSDDLVVPPPRLDLLIKTTCAGASTPAPSVVPAVDRAPVVGQEVTVRNGSWKDSMVVTGYQWMRNMVAIPEATGATYEVDDEDKGKALSVRLTVQRPSYTQENGAGRTVSFDSFAHQVSAGTVPAVDTGGGGGGGGGTPPPAVAPVNTVAPSVDGAAKVGEVLAAEPGTWDTEGLTFAYQWQRDGQAIDGATASVYTATKDDLGKPVSVRVTATKAGRPDGTATSAPVTVGLGDAPTVVEGPVVSGEPEVGERLSVSEGTWSAEGLTFAYQWTRDGAPIAGATEATYTVVDADEDSVVGAVVTASKPGYVDGTAVAEGLTVPSGEEPEPEPQDSTTKVKVLDRPVRAGERAQLKVVVRTVGDVVPTGVVEVEVVGGRLLTRTLDEADAGVRTLKLPKLAVGKHRVKVRFLGSDEVDGSRAKLLKVRVKPAKAGARTEGPGRSVADLW
ncbi:MAG: Ig-like domain-containing protein [Nocardioides marinisabuli]|uniref:Ig-like domain-containing protein n=1 Tax=Nocardioides marinisabuli TaxID=419476 RepID=UPI00321BB5B1